MRGVLVNLGVLVYLGGFGLFKGGFGLFRKRGKMVYSEGVFGLFGGGKWFIRGFWLIRQINQNPPRINHFPPPNKPFPPSDE